MQGNIGNEAHITNRRKWLYRNQFVEIFSNRGDTEAVGLVRLSSNIAYPCELKVDQNLITFASEHDVHKTFASFQPDTVIHLATKFVRSDDDAVISELISSNVKFAGLILDTARRFSVKHFINVSSNWQHSAGGWQKSLNLYLHQ